MKGQNDSKPDSQIKSRGKTQVLYNIISRVVTDMDGKTRTIWEYDYVEIEGEVTKAKVMEAIQKADVEGVSVIPDDIANQYKDAKSELALSTIANMTYAQVDAYIDSNVTNLASAKVYLKKLSRVVLAMLKNG